MHYYIKKLTRLLFKLKLDAIIIYANTYNARFMKAFAGTYPILQNYILITKKSRYITEAHYLELDLRRRTSLAILPTQAEASAFQPIEKKLGKGKKIGIVGDVKYQDIAKVKPAKIIDLTSQADEIITYKSDQYIKNIKSYAQILSKIMQSVRFKPNTNILTYAKAIQKQILNQGFNLAFPIAITSGQDLYETTAAIARDKKIKQSEVICIDMGLKNNIYTTDMTRMFFVNNNEAKNIFAQIKSIHKQIINTFVSPDKTFKQVVSEYKKRFKKSKVIQQVLEQDFGHGVGFAIHEPPALEKTSKKIGTNIIFTLEPTFVTKFGKMRIEDMIGVLANGKAINLTAENTS